MRKLGGFVQLGKKICMEGKEIRMVNEYIVGKFAQSVRQILSPKFCIQMQLVSLNVRRQLYPKAA